MSHGHTGTGSMTDKPATRPLEVVASDWLAAERVSTAHRTERAEDTARDLSAEYEAAIHDATQEEMRLAWEAARAIQATCEMGSSEWADARSVSELLRMEYAARTGHI
jgi:hypothetical protein